MTDKNIDIIRAQPLLQLLQADVQEQLAALPVADVAAGTEVFGTNTRCGGFPVILSGTIRVFRHLANGRRIELYRVTPDEPCILSLGCVLGGDRYPASGIASGPTRMIVLPRELFNRCVADNDAFRTALFRAMGERLANTMELVEEIATLRLDIRLAASLLDHAASMPADQSQVAITHQELADELGTVREMISRLLDDFAQRGMVELGRGRIRIADAAQLRALASSR